MSCSRRCTSHTCSKQTYKGTFNRRRADVQGSRWRVPGRLANAPPPCLLEHGPCLPTHGPQLHSSAPTHLYAAAAQAARHLLRPALQLGCAQGLQTNAHPDPAVEQQGWCSGGTATPRSAPTAGTLGSDKSGTDQQAAISSPLQPSPCAPGEGRAPLQSKTCGAESK